MRSIRLARTTAALAATTALAAGASLTTLAAPAQAHSHDDRSIATVLAVDKGYDNRWGDFDILERAVKVVLAAKPRSAVSVLADGDTRATVFLPHDAAFRALARDLTGTLPQTERAAFLAIAGVADVDTLETVLLHHVIPGKTLGVRGVLALKGKNVRTAAGIPVGIRVANGEVSLRDSDPDATDAKVVRVNVNAGNKQIGHVVNRVIRPIDL